MMRKTPRKRVQRAPFVITVAVAIAAGSCGGKAFDDTQGSGGTAGSGAGNAGKGGSAGKSGSGGKGGSAGTSSTGGSGGGGSECPTSMPVHGTACAMEGQVCSYPNSGKCCPPGQSRCLAGVWSGLISSCNPPPPVICPTQTPSPGDPCSIDPCSSEPSWDCIYLTCPDGTPQLVARCDGSYWSLPQNGCAPVDGGSVCDPLERQLVEFANANRACYTTSDCRTVLGPCANGADYCDGSFFVNKSIDQSKWNGLANELRDCVIGSGSSCAVCDGIPPPPACVGGKCQAG